MNFKIILTYKNLSTSPCTATLRWLPEGIWLSTQAVPHSDTQWNGTGQNHEHCQCTSLNNITSKVRFREKLSKNFVISVRQGDSLYLIFFNSLLEKVISEWTKTVTDSSELRIDYKKENVRINVWLLLMTSHSQHPWRCCTH